MLEIIVEIADAWTETDYNLGYTCAVGGNQSVVWKSILCPMGDAWNLVGFFAMLVSTLLYIVGVLATPVVVIAEFFRRGRPFLSSLRAAIISAAYSVLLFLPYLLGKFKDRSDFNDIRTAGYISIHLFWLFGAGIAWIYALANKSFRGFSTLLTQVHYPQRPNEETITSVAIIVLLLTCAYSALYLWRAHRAGMIRGFAIAPFVLAFAWIFIGGMDCNSYTCNSDIYIDSYPCNNLPAKDLQFESAFSYYRLTLPLILASVAWIAYTSIKLWRVKRGADATELTSPSTPPVAESGDS